MSAHARTLNPPTPKKQNAIVIVVVDVLVIVDVVDIVEGQTKKSNFFIKVLIISDNSDFSIFLLFLFIYFFIYFGGGPPIFFLAIFHLVFPELVHTQIFTTLGQPLLGEK